MIDLSARSTLLEKMDDLGSPEADVVQNLRELEVINTRLGGYKVILDALDKLPLSNNTTILDIGSGGGDTIRAIYRWTGSKRKQVKLVGIDYNPMMVSYATTHSQGTGIIYKQLDVYDDAVLQEHADVVTCSLFLHHFEHQSAVRIVRRMYDIAGSTVIINDLHRHWLAYYAIKVLTALFSKTYMVKYDAPLSVARAFRRQDWLHIMEEAGIKNYTVNWRWAWRWEVIIHKTATDAV